MFQYLSLNFLLIDSIIKIYMFDGGSTSGQGLICDQSFIAHINYIFFIYFFIYNQIPPQSEENNMLHKNIDKIQE